MDNRQKNIAIFLILLSAIGIALYAYSENRIFHGNESDSNEQEKQYSIIEEELNSQSRENTVTTMHLNSSSESVLLNKDAVDIELSSFELMNPIAQIYDYKIPLTDGINEMGSDGLWSYDQMMKNVALWANLCLKKADSSSNIASTFFNSQETYSNISILCQDFSSGAQEIDDFIEVEIDETAAGANDRAKLESSLAQLGPDMAIKEAIYELSDALDNSDYARVIEVVWFLGIYKFDGVSEEFAIYTSRPNVETIFSVAASIYCSFIGGCHGQHPITLNLCFQFEGLPCSRPPNDIFDSINQILTGHEIDTFNQMNNSLIRLLNLYRRGEL